MCANFQAKQRALTFSAQVCPKMDLWLEIEKTNIGIKISIPTLCASFQAKQTTLTFTAQIFPKMDLGLEIEKNNVGIRVNILKIPCVPIFSRNGQL